MLIEIREERSDDVVAVREVNRPCVWAGSGKQHRRCLADKRRRFAFVSCDSERSSGGRYHVQPAHLLLTMLMVWVLGPMAVVPEYQRRGIGTKLIEAGNENQRCRAIHSSLLWATRGYYPRFGSRPAIEYGIKWEWDIPDEVFMCLFSTKRKCRVHLDWRSIGMNFRLYLEHLCQSEPAMPCKIFFCPRIKRNDAERNEFVFVYFVWFVGKSEITLALLIN